MHMYLFSALCSGPALTALNGDYKPLGRSRSFNISVAYFTVDRGPIQCVSAAIHSAVTKFPGYGAKAQGCGHIARNNGIEVLKKQGEK